jgi:hypothetical protein
MVWIQSFNLKGGKIGLQKSPFSFWITSSQLLNQSTDFHKSWNEYYAIYKNPDAKYFRFQLLVTTACHAYEIILGGG